jgi:hypothetical protein
MSGIYITVWDDVKEFDRVLKPTRGGWPHVTLAWTGKNVSHDELKEVAKEVVDYWVMKPLTLGSARVNSFFHEKSGKTRYDVLLVVDEAKDVETSRNVLIKTRFPARQHKFNMMEPHVTAKICWSNEEAEEELLRVSEFLPLKVTVTGVTID